MLDTTIEVSYKEYKRLQERDEWLSCLERAGVDNWQGYDDARDLYREGGGDGED